MAVYAIGDVQGCFDELLQLIELIKFNPDNDKLWFCGDIVNRGPKSLETLRFIKNLNQSAITVLGNHDLHLLALAFHHGKPGKRDTLNEILEAPDREELLHWLRNQPLIHHDPDLNYTLVHAGLHPQWKLKTALTLAHEVETVLRSDQHVDFYRHMYGNKPKYWNNKLQGWDRLRFITNVMTRMRFCDRSGHPALAEKGDLGSQSPGYYAWFMHKYRKTKKNKIIFGHWSTLTDPKIKNIYPIDTGCLWGGKLTAIRIDRKKPEYFQVACATAQEPTN